MRIPPFCWVAAANLLLLAPVGGQAAQTLPLGGDAVAQYLTLDAATGMIYVAYDTQVVAVRPSPLAIAGRLGGMNGVKSVAIVPGGHGYATDSHSATVTVFDPRTDTALSSIPAGADTDFITFDMASGKVFALNDDDGSITVIDPTTNDVVRTIFLPGGEGLGSAAPDGAGHLLVVHPARGELVRLDTRTFEVDRQMPLADCVHPEGLALNRAEGTAYVSCANSKLLTVNLASGTITGSAPIGPRSQTVIYDEGRRRIYVPNGDSTLSVIDTSDAPSLRPLLSLPTGEDARTAVEDVATGDVYVVSRNVLLAVRP